MSNQRFLLSVVSATFLIILAVCALLFAYDALQFWHKPWGREARFSQEVRQQIKGIVNHYEFDSVVIGNSLTQNVPANYLDYKVGGKWVNLSAPGTSLYEKNVLLNYVFKHKKIKSVFYGFWHYGLATPEGIEDTSHYDFLYDENPFNDMKYYLNRKFFSCAIRWSSKPSCLEYDSLDSLGSWMGIENATRNLGGYLKWEFSGQKETTKIELARITQALQKDYNLIPPPPSRNTER